MAAQLTYSAESRTSQDLRANNGPPLSGAPGIRLAAVRQNVGWQSRDLAPGRYTLGSGPDCDIVLSEPGVAPRHCTLMIGDRQSVIKAWSPLTWINDGVVHEGALRHGDRLIVGPVELKVSRLNPGDYVPWNSTTTIRDSIQLPNAPHVQLPQTKPSLSSQSPATFRKDHVDEILSEIQRSLDEVIAREHLIRDSLQREKLVLSQRASELSEQWKALEVSKAQPPVFPEPNKNVWTQLEQQRQELQQTKAELGERYRELAERAATVVRMYRAVKSRTQDQQVHHAALDARETSVRNYIARNQAQQRQLTARAADLERRDETLRLQQGEVQELTAKLTARSRKLEEEHEQRNVKLRNREKFLEEFEGTVSSRFRDVEAEENRLQKLGLQTVQNHEQLKTSLARLEAHQNELDAATAAVAASRRQLDADQVMLVAHQNQYESDFAELVRDRTALSAERQQHVQLKEQLSTRNQDLLNREQRLQELEKELEQSQASINAQLKELSDARDALSREQQTVIARSQDLDHRETTHSAQASELERRHGVVASMAELEQHRQELSRQQSELRQQLEQHDARQAQLEADEHALASQQELIAQERAQYADLQTQLQHLQLQQEALTALESELNSRSNLLHSREMDAFALAEQTAALEAQRQSLTHERDELHAQQQIWLTGQAERDELESRLASLHEELRAESQQVAQLRDQRSQLECERQELVLKKTTLDELERSLHAQTALLASSSMSSQSNSEELVQREAALLERERELVEKEERLRSLQLSLDAGVLSEAADDNLQMQQRELAEKSVRLQQQQEHFESRQADLDADFQNLARLRTELEAERSRDVYEREQQQHQRLALEQAESALSQAQQELAERQEQFEKQQAEHEFSAAIPVAQPEPHISAETLEQVHQELADARHEIETLRQQVSTHSAEHDDRELKIRIATEQLQVERERLRSLQELLELRQGVLNDQDQQLVARAEEIERLRAELDQAHASPSAEPMEDEPAPKQPSSPVSNEPGSLLSLFMTNKEPAQEPALHSSLTTPEAIEPDSDDHGNADATAMKLRSELASLFGLGAGAAASSQSHDDHEQQPDEVNCQESSFNHGATTVPEATPASSETQSNGEEEEESVDAYMRRLLARTRITSPPAVDPVAPSKPTPAPEIADIPSVSTSDAIPPEAAPAPVKKARRLEPNEKESIRANLDSFRELANFSARTAVATSRVSRTSALLRVMLFMAAVGWIVTAALLTTPFWLTDDFFLETLAVGGITAIMTVMAGIRLWEIKQMAAVPGRQREQSTQTAEPVTRKPNPADDQSKSPLSFL